MKVITLSQDYVALVDDEDFEKLNKFSWYAHKALNTYYACRKRRKSEVENWHKNMHVAMHREIMGQPKGMEVDHKDHNGLNCQKSNMRIVTHMHNMWNTPKRKTSKTGYRGISFDAQTRKWRAIITINHRSISLGRFVNLEEAIRARKIAEKKYFNI